MAAKKRPAVAVEAPDDRSEIARRAFGPASANLKVIARLLDVKIGQRGCQVAIDGAPAAKVRLAHQVVETLLRLAAEGGQPGVWDAECLVNLFTHNPQVDPADYSSAQLRSSLARKAVLPRTPAQRAYLEAMEAHDLVFCLGPAGTGKTYLAVAMAVACLARQEVSRIILTRPAVEAGERLGFLPGDLAEKVNPYLRPLYDALDDLIAYERYARLAEQRVIEVAPLAFMRGRTLGQAFVILDEAQNCTREQMKMFLTRLGPDSRAVVTGDPGQSDLPGGRAEGLSEAERLLNGLEGIAFCRFSSFDVVRHRLVRRILEAYQAASA